MRCFKPWSVRTFRHPACRAFLLTVFCVRELAAISISEIHYDPPGSAVGLEFVELVNESPTVVDLSGWRFTEGIDFTFPAGTLIRGKGYLVICGNEAAFRAAYPNAAVAGQFVGKLDSAGETLVLSNLGGGEVVSVRYRDRGKWTSIPTGTGHTLSLRRPHDNPAEPESWTASALPGGTPGAANFSSSGTTETDLIPAGAQWRYRKGTGELSTPPGAWKEPGFDDSSWLTGPVGIGYGDGDDATDLSGDMPNGYLSVAVRRAFNLSAAALNQIDELVLAINFDDGFVAYLNGVEVARSGLPGEIGELVPHDTPAVGHEAGSEELFLLPRARLVAGLNVLAVQGHNSAIDSSDFSLAPRLFRRRLAVASRAPAGLVLNELLGRTSGARWLELMNTGAQEVDLEGFHLSDNAADLGKYRFPPGTKIPSRGYLVIEEAGSGLDFSTPEVRLFFSLPDLTATVLAQFFENVPTDGLAANRSGMSDARWPDGSGDLAYSSHPTPGAPNSVEVSEAVVINEILYNPPHGNSTGELVELHNRTDAPEDLSAWSFSKGISYRFAPGTILPARGYLVVAQDPAAVSAAHALPGVLGPFEGSLASSGELLELVDEVGNVVDQVRYFDGGRWSEWADGGGSSLELIDPDQDNSFASAWAPSEESSRAPWKQFTYTASYAVEAESELQFLLLDAGTTLIDDVSLRRVGSATEYIPNGGLETGTANWSFQGTHVRSGRTTADAHTGLFSLELTASGAGDAGVNKIETETVPVMTGGTYTVSFWAKWVRGSTKLLTRADSKSGASLQRAHELELPAAPGTPGRVNSVRATLLASSAAGNLGPVIAEVTHTPAVPTPIKTVRVTARAFDSNGLQSLNVHYRPGGPGDGVFTQSPLFDDGLHGDGLAGDGMFAGSIPPQPLSTRVIYFIEGVDVLGAVRRFPVEAPERTLLYVVEAPAATALVNVRLNLDDRNETELVTRLLHSDDLVDGSFVYNDEDVYYNVGVRYRGSPWGRPGEPKNFRVRFGGDRRFLHDLKSVNLSRSAWALNESMAYHAVARASGPGSNAPSSDYFFTRTFRNGAFHGQMALLETIDARHVERAFPRDAEGLVFKAAARPYLNDVGVMDGVFGTTFTYYGSMNNFEHERYRWYYTQGTRQLEDRWDELVSFCSTMDPAQTTTAAFDQAIESTLDVEQFLRVLAARVMHDDWDTVGVGGGHNAYLYFAPLEGRWKLLPWDMDNTWGNAQAKFFPEDADPGVTRLIQRPKFRRMYLRVVQQLLGTVYDPEVVRPYLQQLSTATGLDMSPILSFITTRRPGMEALIPEATFRVTAIGVTAVPEGWSGEIFSGRSRERLRGSAPIEVATIVVLVDGAVLEAPITWTTTGWAFDLPIDGPERLVEVLGFSTDGELLASLELHAFSTVDWAAPALETVAPSVGPAAGGTRIRLGGSGFQHGIKVLVAGAEAREVSRISPAEVEATTPPGTVGPAQVSVVNADGRRSDLAGAFTYSGAGVFLRGDASGDGQVDLRDALKVLFYLFVGGQLTCLDAADVGNDGVVNVADVLAILSYLYRGGPAPAAPFPTPGSDPVAPPDFLGCR